MRAAWYERAGPASEVLEVGEMAAPEPGPGEVRVRIRFSGVNPGDTQEAGRLGRVRLAVSRVVPHSEGSGSIESVGDGVDPGRVGQRVWFYGALALGASGSNWPPFRTRPEAIWASLSGVRRSPAALSYAAVDRRKAQQTSQI